jgi:ectoine hydroxylase-related dioxygenase (phytanoyl-CoA dioxygenase family)
MIDAPVVGEAVATRGFAVIESCLSDVEVATLAKAIDGADLAGRAGLRNLFRNVPAILELSRHPGVRRVVETVLGLGAFAVRAILFDKTPQANWNVAWHQDLTIAVARREDVAGYGAWSEKEGVVHVQPPASVLEGMLAVRVHLDDCAPQNGPLRVLPGSHRQGRLDRAAIADWQRRASEVPCVVPRGGLVVMRPLLLHASSVAEAASRRRVIHLEFAAAELDPPLEWHERIAIAN